MQQRLRGDQQKVPGAGRRRSRTLLEECPDFSREKRLWFEYWDRDGSGSLEREEVVRGLAKSFRCNDDAHARRCKKRLNMRMVVEEMWSKVDRDGNNCITLDEFCLEGKGLADQILKHFTARGSPRATQRSPRGAQSPRQGRIVRRRSVEGQSSPQTRRDARTDVAESVDNDRPFLTNRPSLGFSGYETEASSSVSPTNQTRGTMTRGNSDAGLGLPGESWSVLGRRRSHTSVTDVEDSNLSLELTPSGGSVISPRVSSRRVSSAGPLAGAGSQQSQPRSPSRASSSGVRRNSKPEAGLLRRSHASADLSATYPGASVKQTGIVAAAAARLSAGYPWQTG